MDKAANLQMMKELCEAKGVSGFEDEVLERIRPYVEDLGRVTEDSLRNLYVERNENTGTKPVFMLDAHTDEVGFMVQAVKPDGTLRIITLGGWVLHNVPSHRVWVRVKDGSYILGIVASKPPHFMTEAERNKPLDIADISVDVGATSREEAINDFGVRIGEPVVPDSPFSYDEKHDLMVGKAFDNRAGCACIAEVMRRLKGESLNVDVVGAFASQEEVGSRGASLTCQRVKPSIAIVFEGCPADDTCAESYMVQTALKKGPMLRHYDKKMITNPRYQRFALNLAEELGIPCQEAVRSGGSTNGAFIHVSNEGVPCIVIGVPVRYAHTHYCYSSYSDYENAVKLALEIVKRMDEKTIKSF